jgi:hypothetical protein
MNKTLTLTPEQVESLKILLGGFDSLSEQAAERYYDRYIFEPEFEGQRPVEKYMKGSYSYAAFKEVSRLVDAYDSEPEQYAQAFEKSPLCELLRKKYETCGRFQEISDNLVNALINAKVNIVFVPYIRDLGSAFVWETTREGRNYWKQIYLGLPK